ncbi:MAG TPA: fructosamine kinase family protein [Burkholderiales bacterium]|nr:fructosamine kinase family protein [Burkholderiales bacterium]
MSWRSIAEQISAVTGQAFSIGGRTPVGGGCINETSVIEGSGRRYFVKLNDARHAAMFAAEAAGLAEIARTRTVRVPLPVCHGADSTAAWLVLEHVELRAGDGAGERALGAGLAAMHRVTAATFGWAQDNTIGATPQPNAAGTDWAAFWRERRLGFQLRLAARNGHGGSLQRKGERLLDGLDRLLHGHSPAASLLHGDLWGGNHAFDREGRPVLFDPAVYYGDREADIAMTELFGGFGAGFYAAYEAAWPLDSGYRARKTLYNLYHVLNHLNLFGGGYLHQAEGMIDRLLAEI